MMRRFILTLEILFVSLFLLGGSFRKQKLPGIHQEDLAGRTTGPLHMLWEVWTERIT